MDVFVIIIEIKTRAMQWGEKKRRTKYVYYQTLFEIPARKTIQTKQFICYTPDGRPCPQAAREKSMKGEKKKKPANPCIIKAFSKYPPKETNQTKYFIYYTPDGAPCPQAACKKSSIVLMHMVKLRSGCFGSLTSPHDTLFAQCPKYRTAWFISS